MTANITPIFTLTPVISGVAIATANTARDGSGTVGTVITGSTNGTRITRITIRATSNTTAGQVRLFLFNGSAQYMAWKEIAVAATTVSATVQEFNYTIDLPGEYALILPSGYSLVAATHNAENFHVTAEGGNY